MCKCADCAKLNNYPHNYCCALECREHEFCGNCIKDNVYYTPLCKQNENKEENKNGFKKD